METYINLLPAPGDDRKNLLLNAETEVASGWYNFAVTVGIACSIQGNRKSIPAPLADVGLPCFQLDAVADDLLKTGSRVGVCRRVWT